jgi:predicted nucleic acid-binding protein
MRNLVLLIDTNVVLDYLTNREPYFVDAYQILQCCAEKRVRGFIAAHSVTNIFYILRKHFSPAERRKLLLELCELLEICGLEKMQIINSLSNKEFDDLEDCVQAECAKSIRADYIITRNVKDFVHSPVLAIPPEDLLRLLKSP